MTEWLNGHDAKLNKNMLKTTTKQQFKWDLSGERIQRNRPPRRLTLKYIQGLIQTVRSGTVFFVRTPCDQLTCATSEWSFPAVFYNTWHTLYHIQLSNYRATVCYESEIWYTENHDLKLRLMTAVPNLEADQYHKLSCSIACNCFNLL